MDLEKNRGRGQNDSPWQGCYSNLGFLEFACFASLKLQLLYLPIAAHIRSISETRINFKHRDLDPIDPNTCAISKPLTPALVKTSGRVQSLDSPGSSNVSSAIGQRSLSSPDGGAPRAAANHW